MRELVGIKVGLEYIKQSQDDKKRMKEELENIKERR